MSREVLQQALAVLKGCLEHPDAQDSIIAIEHELAQPEQEPVAHMYAADLKKFETSETYADAFSISVSSFDFGTTVPLFTSPPQRQPLTNEELAGIYMTTTGLDFYRNFARAIEAKHGIGNKT